MKDGDAQIRTMADQRIHRLGVCFDTADDYQRARHLLMEACEEIARLRATLAIENTAERDLAEERQEHRATQAIASRLRDALNYLQDHHCNGPCHGKGEHMQVMNAVNAALES